MWGKVYLPAKVEPMNPHPTKNSYNGNFHHMPNTLNNCRINCDEIFFKMRFMAPLYVSQIVFSIDASVNRQITFNNYWKSK